MASKKKDLEEKAHLESNSQGDVHDPLNVANIFKENGVEEDAEFKNTKDQKLILDAVGKNNLTSKCCSLLMAKKVLEINSDAKSEGCD